MRIPTRARIYVYLLSVLAILGIVLAGGTVGRISSQDAVLLLIFAAFAIMSEIYATWIPAYKWEISSSIAVYLATLFIFGPSIAALFVFGSSIVSEFFLRWSANRKNWRAVLFPVLFNASQLAVAITVAGLLLRLTNYPAGGLQAPSHYLIAVCAFLIYALVNLFLVTSIINLVDRKPIATSLGSNIRDFTIQYIVLCVSALLLAVLYTISPWHVLLALFPLALVHVSFRSYLKLQTEARKTFEKISLILDARDHYTAVHSEEVAELAVRIGEEMGLSQGEIERIDIAARVHDIGKIAIPDSILLKPGPLDDEEWKIMKQHPVTSADLISGLEIYSPVVEAVRHEHEKWNGSGYPDGLAGEEIPFVSRVIAAADVYNALTTDRPYRSAFSKDKAAEIIRDSSGVDLDPQVARALLRVINSMVGEESEASDPETINA